MKKFTSQSRRRGTPRVPIAYASLLIIALVAVVGFAAFSPSIGSGDATSTSMGAEATTAIAPMSARVASAVLAIRVADADTRTATTQTSAAQDVESETADVPDVSEDAPAVEDAAAIVEETTTTTPSPAALQSAPSDTTPPSFKITSPDDGTTVKSTTVKFSGTVEKGASVRSGPYEATVNDDGTWSILLTVVPGANGASFTATDAAGNTSSARIVVTYTPPTTTTTAAPAPAPAAAPPPPDDHKDDHTDTAPTTTAAPHTDTTTTTKAPSSSSSSTSSKWSSKWPADAGGIRNVETWRPTVAKYWAADRVDCVLGIILRESRGDPRAYNSSYGASGLMQHLIKYWPSRAASAGFKDSNGLVASPYNGEANIAAGAVIAGSGSKWYAPWSRLPSYGSCSG